MSEPARRLPRSEAKRLRTIVDSLPVANNRGNTGWGRRVQGRGVVVINQGNGVAYVYHGDDPTVPRENAALVRWVGAALPENRILTDDWLNVTLTDEQLAELLA